MRLAGIGTLRDKTPSTDRLAERLSRGEETISFDKDDDDTLDFVCAAANLRGVVYGIPNKTRWEIKGRSHHGEM